VRIDHFSEGTIAKRRQASLSQHTPTVTPRGPKRDSFEEQREKSVQGQAHTKRDSPQQLPQAVRIDPFSEGTIVKRRQASLSQHTPTVTPRGPKRDSFEEQREKSVQGQAHSKRDSSAQPECSRSQQVPADLVETEVVHADLVVADESEVSKIRKHYEALHRMELAEAEIALLSGEQLANLKKQQQKDLMAVLELLPKTVGICRC
jgi:hypothetical protein